MVLLDLIALGLSLGIVFGVGFDFVVVFAGLIRAVGVYAWFEIVVAAFAFWFLWLSE